MALSFTPFVFVSAAHQYHCLVGLLAVVDAGLAYFVMLDPALWVNEKVHFFALFLAHAWHWINLLKICNV